MIVELSESTSVSIARIEATFSRLFLNGSSSSITTYTARIKKTNAQSDIEIEIRYAFPVVST